MTFTRRDFVRTATVSALGVSALHSRPALAAVARAFDATGAAHEALRLAVVWPETVEHRALLARLDDTHAIVDGGVEVLLWPGDLARLRATGVPHRVTAPDLRPPPVHRAALTTTPAPVQDYVGFDQMREEFEQLAADSSAAAFFTLPHRTLEGREIFGIDLWVGDRHDGRPTFYVDGCHHAREWPAADYCRLFAHHLVANDRDPRIRAILERVVVAIVPVVNADGYVHSFSYDETVGNRRDLGIVAGGQGAYARKNNRLTPVDSSDDPDLAQDVGGTHEVDPHHGVDPNRNYAWLWGGTSGGLVADPVPVFASTSANPTDQTYHGAAPFSEPCARNNYDLMRHRNITMYLSNHTAGRLTLRPWSHTPDPSPDEALLVEVGRSLSDAMADPSRGVPPYQNIPGLGLYPTYGSSKDWAYASLRTLGFTLEHSTEFHRNYDREHAPGVEWPLVMEQFLRGAEAAVDPRTHAVIRGHVVDAAGRPTTATLRLVKRHRTPSARAGIVAYNETVNGEDGFDEEIDLALPTRPDGSFEWHVPPSTRPHVQAQGGRESYLLHVDDKPVLEVEVARGRSRDLGVVRRP